MIEVLHLSKSYDRRKRGGEAVLKDISFTLPDTGFVCIVGASGCGKTSLLNAVGGLDTFDRGTVAVGAVSASRYGTGEMEAERNNSFGYIFQNYYLLLEHSVAYNVYLGLHALKLTHQQRLERVESALKAVNMERYSRRIVGELSGGQQQRVAIARALARRPRVIFADEPTGNLDEENTVNICTLLRQISRTSLVVMVTHELDIARFFADRILTIKDGILAQDSTHWQRDSLRMGEGDNLYIGDYQADCLERDAMQLQILREEGAPPVALTIAVLKDRVIVKTADSRTVSCSRPEEGPALREGSRPALTLHCLEESAGGRQAPVEPPAQPGRAGGGLPLGMMAREAGSLLRGKKGRSRLGTWIFLAAMAVLSLMVVGDYLTVSSVDPHDFVTTDSHILEISLERGAGLPMGSGGMQGKAWEYLAYLDESGVDFDAIPYVNRQLRCSLDAFVQMGDVSAPLPAFSYARLSRLDASTLIYGRMPEAREEIVIDRWVLDAFLAEDGVVQNSLGEITKLLGARLSYVKSDFTPVIVGICDGGEPTLYATDAALITVGVGGADVMSLSQFLTATGGKFQLSGGMTEGAGFTLAADECILNPDVVGVAYQNRVGSQYQAGNGGSFTIADVFYGLDSVGAVVGDEALEGMLRAMAAGTADCCIYCEDKQAMLDYLALGLPEGLDGQIAVTVKDANSDAWSGYRYQSSLKADARTIVTVTVLLLSMVMLYLLQRSCVQQRVGMIAVYRLLGIPGQKLLVIFAVESTLLWLTGALPAAAATFLVVKLLGALPSLSFTMVLPWQAAALVCLAILGYDLLVSLLPVRRLLRVPPARLAGRYDI